MNKELVLLTHDLGVGGSQMVVINLANEALRNNFVVKIITFSNNNILENKLIKSDNLFIYNLNKFNSSKGLLKKIYLFLIFFNYININRPKLVHSHLWEIDIMYLYVFFFFKNVHIIHTLHSPGGSYIKNNMLSRFVVKIEKIFINQYNKLNIILVSDQISNVLKNIFFYKKKYTVITNGIDINNYHISERKNKLFNDLPSDSKIFIFPSRYQPSKGHLLLFKALKKILLDNKNIYLLLVGSNLEKNLKLHAIDLKIENNIIFYG
jgi:glycosyltransferase involved in cell wall biosynthesis